MQKEFFDNLDKALSKMPSTDSTLVYRMDCPSGEADIILNWFEKQLYKKFKIPYFLSTAKENWRITQ